MVLKWLERKQNEANLKRTELERLEEKGDRQHFLRCMIKMIKENEIEDAVYAVWTSKSATVITEEFLYYNGSSRKGDWTVFHRGEATALNKIVSIESDYDIGYESVRLRFIDGSERYVKTFDNTKEMDRFFKEKTIS